jgi:hypothetical protein
LEYSFVIATQNTGKKTGKMGVLFFVNSLIALLG